MSHTWQRHVHRESVWGTVITFDLRDEVIDKRTARAACADAAAELHRIDRWLSPFREDSELMQLRSNQLRAKEASAPVREVVAECGRIKALTKGRFDPWTAPGGFDPSGYVKGWGADRTAAILTDHGFANVSVNAAGDVTCRGRARHDIDGWSIGIIDPRDRTCTITTVIVKDAHVATSGCAEQLDHIIDPTTSRPTTRFGSATVVHPDGGTADALATALFVAGPAGLEGLADLGCSALLVTQDHAWTTGPSFARLPSPRPHAAGGRPAVGG